eukprot:4621422-Alexandrium_andersonii.AAC.1
MSASLVGSEMCIRDSPLAARVLAGWRPAPGLGRSAALAQAAHDVVPVGCLLYTSDAADDM